MIHSTLHANAYKNTSIQYDHFNKVSHNTLEYWLFKHHTIVKASEIAIGVFGAMAIGASIGGCFGLLGGIVMSTIGLAAIAISTIAWHCLGLLIPPHHNMKNHIYAEKSCEGGRLYYQGDVPILEITAQDPYKAGKAHSTLVAEHSQEILWKMRLLELILGESINSQELSTFYKKIQTYIPHDFIQEMQGFVDGYNDRRSEWIFKGPKITIEDLIFMHMLPDSWHFSPTEYEDLNFTYGKVACTTILVNNKKLGPVFGRNLDWDSFGILGRKSLIINRKNLKAGEKTIDISFPGFMGVLTGMNSSGLSLAMNVSPGDTETIKGIPAAFYNRLILENCKNLQEVHEQIKTNHPLGPFHLTVADPKKSGTYHFYQNSSLYQPHTQRITQKNKALVTCNCSYDTSGPEHDDGSSSKKRHKILKKYFETNKDLIQDTQKLPSLVGKALSFQKINDIATVHSVVMQPKNKMLTLAFDNAWAGEKNRQLIDTQPLFS